MRRWLNNFVLQELKLIDPSMGSGHVLVYAFDVFMQLYEAEGESPRNAVEFILQKNLYGLDIDKRAFQLAYFALMMKGRQSNRRILTKNIELNIYAISDNFGISEAEIQLLHFTFPDNEKGQEDLLALVAGFKNARDLGSLIEFNEIDFENLKVGLEVDTISFVDLAIHKMVSVGEMLQQKYDVGVTNPPYMGSAGMNKELSTFVKKYYPDSKSDLFSVFIERLHSMIQPTGYTALITQHAWMFLSSFEKLRIKINQQTIINMIHLGTRAFEEIGGEVVQTTAFVLSPNKKDNHFGNYLRLVDFPDHQLKELKVLEAISNEQVDYFYQTVQDNYSKIPGIPISYWVSETMISTFINKNFSKYSFSDGQILTGDNDRYLKYLWEINKNKIGEENGWMLHAKGGEYRKWYGNIEWIVNWNDDAITHYKEDRIARFPKKNILFQPGVTWSLVTTNPTFSVRKLEDGITFNKAAATILFVDIHMINYSLGLLNSKPINEIMKIINPTLNNNIKDVLSLPFINSTDFFVRINFLVNINITISKKDWNSFEKSWAFLRHPLV